VKTSNRPSVLTATTTKRLENSV